MVSTPVPVSVSTLISFASQELRLLAGSALIVLIPAPFPEVDSAFIYAVCREIKNVLAYIVALILVFSGLIFVLVVLAVRKISEFTFEFSYIHYSIPICSDLIISSSPIRSSSLPIPFIVVAPCIHSEEGTESKSPHRTHSTDSIVSPVSVQYSTSDSGTLVTFPCSKTWTFNNTPVVSILYPGSDTVSEVTFSFPEAEIKVSEINATGVDTKVPGVNANEVKTSEVEDKAETTEIPTINIENDVTETAKVETPEDENIEDLNYNIETPAVEAGNMYTPNSAKESTSEASVVVAETPEVETAQELTPEPQAVDIVISEVKEEDIENAQTRKETVAESLNTSTETTTAAKTPAVQDFKETVKRNTANTEIFRPWRNMVRRVNPYQEANAKLKRVLVAQGRPSQVPFEYANDVERRLDMAASGIYALTLGSSVEKFTTGRVFGENGPDEDVDILASYIRYVADFLTAKKRLNMTETKALRDKFMDVLRKMEKTRESLKFEFAYEKYFPYMLSGRVLTARGDPKVWMSICWDVFMSWVDMESRKGD